MSIIHLFNFDSYHSSEYQQKRIVHDTGYPILAYLKSQIAALDVKGLL